MVFYHNLHALNLEPSLGKEPYCLGNEGSSAGWIFIILLGNASIRGFLTILINPASMTSSTPHDFSSSAIFLKNSSFVANSFGFIKIYFKLCLLARSIAKV